MFLYFSFCFLLKINNVYMLQAHSYLLANLAVSDFLMGIYLIIIAAVDVRFRGNYAVHDIVWRRSGLCSLTGFLSATSAELSVLTLTVITMDRFVTIAWSFHMTRLGLRKIKVIVVGLWTIVLVLCTAPYFDRSYFGQFYGQSEMCLPVPIASQRQTDLIMSDSYTIGEEQFFAPIQSTSSYHSGWEYSVFIFIGINGTAFLLIIIMYVWMFISVKKIQAAVKTSELKTDLRIARKMLLIVTTDACCWIPVIALGIYSLHGNTIHQRVSWRSSSLLSSLCS